MENNELINDVLNKNETYHSLHKNFHDLVNKQIGLFCVDDAYINENHQLLHSPVVMLLCHEIETLRLKLCKMEILEKEVQSLKEKFEEHYHYSDTPYPHCGKTTKYDT